MAKARGGCLCGNLRYEVAKKPARTTICHCKFCQRATGGAYMVEPIFDTQDFAIIKGSPTKYVHVSEGSGKEVNVHFCANCGTKLYLTFERFIGVVGVHAGTLDEPSWLGITPENSKHIFLGVAQKGTVIPAHVNTFIEHTTTTDGTPVAPIVFEIPHVIGN